MKKNIILGFLLISLLTILIGCGKSSKSTSGETASYVSSLSLDDIFTKRDLEQTADLDGAKSYTVKDNKDITIEEEGVYVITGKASNVSIIVNTNDDAKVQLVLNNLSITNDSNPCVYVKKADKVFVTTEGDNKLIVKDSFSSDGDTNTDAVIFSKDDIVLNGKGTLTIESSENGISSKDDLKITGGTISIKCTADALEANDSIAIADGNITIETEKDGLHAEYDEDNKVGYVYIASGKISIKAGDDAIHATTIAQIDGGEISLEAREGIEGTYIQINGGTINIEASDDGINAGDKSDAYDIVVEINGSELTINMGAGDTDALDSNGYLYINGGTINITAQSPFDYEKGAQYNGGKLIVNGNETTEISNQMMGGGGHGPNSSNGGPNGGKRNVR